MIFTRRLRPGVPRGDITCSVRIWHSPRVKVGHRYDSLGVGSIEIDSIQSIELSDITPELARESGFSGVVDLLKIAKHGSGRNVYLVRFHRVNSATAAKKKGAPVRKPPDGERQRKRIVKIVSSLPEAEARPAGRHMSLEVRTRRFGWFLVDHHGDGRVAINCKGSAEMHDILKQLAPAHFTCRSMGAERGSGCGWTGRSSTGMPWSWRSGRLTRRRRRRNCCRCESRVSLARC